jgi:hypothetical protein
MGSFITPDGTNVPNSSANAFIGVERFAHFQYLFDHPAGFLVAQAFGSLSNPTVGGMNLGSVTGASNFNLAGFFWPYADFEGKQYLVIGAYLYPSTGTHNRDRPLNFAALYQPNGESNWTGDLQIGWEHGVGDQFSYDVAFDDIARTKAGGWFQTRGFRLMRPMDLQPSKRCDIRVVRLGVKGEL